MTSFKMKLALEKKVPPPVRSYINSTQTEKRVIESNRLRNRPKFGPAYKTQTFFEGKKGLKSFFGRKKEAVTFLKGKDHFFRRKKRDHRIVSPLENLILIFQKANFWVRKSFSRKKDDCQEFTRKNMTHTLTSFFHEYK